MLCRRDWSKIVQHFSHLGELRLQTQPSGLSSSTIPFRAGTHKRRRRSALVMSHIPHYADLPLDRAGYMRKDAEGIKKLLESSTSKFVLLHQYSGFLELQTGSEQSTQGPKYKAITVSASQLPQIDDAIGPIFLGLDNAGVAYFAVSLTDQGAEALSTNSEIKGQWVELRREGGPNLSPPDAALIAYAAGLTTWARKTAYSPQSGNSLQPLQGGHARAGEKERSVFPRIDPAVIMSVVTGDWILLGRQAKWSPGRFSLLAGFCEVGETLEQAVVRETFEEAGVRVKLGSVKYLSSQPWPFPQTLMIGFSSEAEPVESLDSLTEEDLAAIEKLGMTDDEVMDACGVLPVATNPDADELEAAFWFHRSFVQNSFKGKLPAGVHFAIPGPHALANSIITEWANTKPAQPSWPGQEWPDVEIDYGRFKYILLRLSDRDENSKLIVRGDKDKEYHADILEAVQHEVKAVGLEVEVLGGGRIENGIQEIRVFGYSMAFGPAPHALTAALLRRAYPMALISASHGGY